MTLQDALNPPKKFAKKRESNLRSAIADRGHLIYNVWVGYSHKLKQTLVLNSDVAVCHVVMLETDPHVIRYVLEAPSHVTVLDEKTVRTRFDASVYFDDGTFTWDEVKSDLTAEQAKRSEQLRAQRQIAAEHGVNHRVFTRDDFTRHLPRIFNGLRMLKTLGAARDLSLAVPRTAILAATASGPANHGTFRGLAEGDQGLNLAAAYALLLEGVLTTDLGTGPISDGTMFMRASGAK
jgi:hypothetical protein